MNQVNSEVGAPGIPSQEFNDYLYSNSPQNPFEGTNVAWIRINWVWFCRGYRSRSNTSQFTPSPPINCPLVPTGNSYI